MRRSLHGALRHSGGNAAVEFALAFPILIALMLGIAQTGLLFYADAAIHSAVADGARYATTFPSPTEQQIRDRILLPRWGVERSRVQALTVDVETSGGSTYVDINLIYQQPLNFIFATPSVTLTSQRRAFMYGSEPAPGSSPPAGSASGGETTPSTSSSTGGSTEGGGTSESSSSSSSSTSSTSTSSGSTGDHPSSSGSRSSSGGAGKSSSSNGRKNAYD